MSTRFNLAKYNLVSTSQATFKDSICFAGRWLAQAVPNAKILDISIGSAAIESTTFSRVKKSGSFFVDSRNGARQIVVTIELPLERKSRSENARKLRAWAETSEPAPMSLYCVDGEIEVLMTDFSEYSIRNWWEPIELTFTAWNPFFVDVEAHSAGVGTKFTLGGSGEPFVWIEHAVSSELQDPEWVIDGVKRIKVPGTFKNGTLIVDFETLMVYHEGISAAVTPASRFPDFRAGSHIITGPDGGVVHWKERWL